MRYYVWHDDQVKTSNNLGEVLNYGGAYAVDMAIGKTMGQSFGYILPNVRQWMSVSPGDIPKAFVLGLMLLEVYL